MPLEQTAQSAHKYLQNEGLAEKKTKVKTRGTAAAGLEPIAEKKKRNGLFSAFQSKNKRKEQAEDGEESDNEAEKDSIKSRWANLGRRSAGLMHQLLRTSQDKTQGMSDMRWDRFVKVR